MNSDADLIENYLRKLKSRLRGLPEAERDRVVLEIQTHLEGRAVAGALHEAIQSFGPPEKLAQGFADDFELTQQRMPKTAAQKQMAAALAAARYLGAGVLGFVSLMLFMLGGGALVIAVLDILYPRDVGVFVYDYPDGKTHEINGSAMVGATAPPRGDDVLGSWIVLIGLGLAALLITLAVIILRFGAWRLLPQSKGRRRTGTTSDVEI